MGGIRVGEKAILLQIETCLCNQGSEGEEDPSNLPNFGIDAERVGECAAFPANAALSRSIGMPLSADNPTVLHLAPRRPAPFLLRAHES